MDRKIYTIPETTIDLKLDKAEVYSRFKNGSRRLKQAIDFLLDYIIELEERSQYDIEQPECQSAESPLTSTPKRV